MRPVPQPCPACGAAALEVFFEAPRVPVFCNVLWSTSEAALASPMGTIELAYCNECGLLTNVAFDESIIEYEGTYENSLHFSPKFQAFANELADHLVGSWDLHGKQLLELGCGFGDFLASLCERGNGRARSGHSVPDWRRRWPWLSTCCGNGHGGCGCRDRHATFGVGRTQRA